MIHFVEVNKDNFYHCLQLSVFESQRSFVASNETSLAEAYIHLDKVEPYCIYSDKTMVGFIQFIPDDKDNSAMYLWRFMIDQKYQGNGYGKEAIKLFIDIVKTRHLYKAIKLSFDPENSNAERLYSSFGFTKTGDICDGELEMILYL